MVCSTAILSSTLALSLLRHSSPPSQSFVLSPFSLNTALSIILDGANGTTQTELTNLLLNGCSPSDVTDFYSSLALSIPSTKETGVSFKSANRFFIDNSMPLKEDYQTHIGTKYNAKAENIDFSMKNSAVKHMNEFIEQSTDGMIKDMIKTDDIEPGRTVAFLINAIHFLGKWKYSFNPTSTRTQYFRGDDGKRKMDFMMGDEAKYRLNWNNDFGTALLIPYKKMRSELTGEHLIHILKGAKVSEIEIVIPKFKIESQLDGKEVLSKMGVSKIFNEDADLSKITSIPLLVSKIQHNAAIEIDEQGTKAAAVTVHSFSTYSGGPITIVIDRPSLFGILRNDDILFLGQIA